MEVAINCLICKYSKLKPNKMSEETIQAQNTNDVFQNADFDGSVEFTPNRHEDCVEPG